MIGIFNGQRCRGCVQLWLDCNGLVRLVASQLDAGQFEEVAAAAIREYVSKMSLCRMLADCYMGVVVLIPMCMQDPGHAAPQEDAQPVRVR